MPSLVETNYYRFSKILFLRANFFSHELLQGPSRRFKKIDENCASKSFNGWILRRHPCKVLHVVKRLLDESSEQERFTNGLTNAIFVCPAIVPGSFPALLILSPLRSRVEV